MPIAAVFLDLGNTLLYERIPRAAIYSEEARHQGLAIAREEMGLRMARAHAELPQELEGAFRYTDAWFRSFQRHIFAPEGLAPAQFDALSEQLFARFEDARTFALYPGARELLGTLRARRLRLGLISNWSARLPQLLRALELDSAFDFVLGSAALGCEKPDPAIFRLALERVGLAPGSCLHAGDDARCDGAGALSCGIAAVLVDHQNRLGARERELCPVVSSLAELQDLILERAA
ncbi:MAG: HAD family hydrolase [Planctomycetes bacterium]|nr:HAD family hydrolase [Planctomycetota bacterium]